MLSEVFYSYLLATLSALIITVLGVCYKSKCRTIDCFGVHIERDVEDEIKLDKTSSDKV